MTQPLWQTANTISLQVKCMPMFQNDSEITRFVKLSVIINYQPPLFLSSSPCGNADLNTVYMLLMSVFRSMSQPPSPNKLISNAQLIIPREVLRRVFQSQRLASLSSQVLEHLASFCPSLLPGAPSQNTDKASQEYPLLLSPKCVSNPSNFHYYFSTNLRV